MLHLHKPTREELRFRQELLSDPSTMSYNHAYGGTIVFPPARWEGWAAHWLDAADGARFYRYLAREDGIFVGETAYHYDEAQRIYICDVIVHARYRHQGYGREGLRLLCDAARAQGVNYFVAECWYDGAEDWRGSIQEVNRFVRGCFR